ncbi:MAG: PKD domain-containing protein [Bacteroidota bacterium]
MKQTVLPSCLFLLFFIVYSGSLAAQCPGCQVDVPGGIAEDTIFLAPIPDGRSGEAYSEDVSFRLPKTTTPVSETDPNIPPNLPIDDIVISSVSNLPPGLSWKANRDNYQPGDNPDGCIKLCGTPLVAGWYTLEVKLTATIIVVSQESSFFLEMYIAPPVSSNDGFTMTNTEGCGAVEVAFNNNIPSNGNPGYSYFWDFGNGSTSADENPSNQLYDTPGSYVVDYTATIDTAGYFLTSVTLLESGCQDIFGAAPDIFVRIKRANGTVIYQSPGVSNTFPPLSFPVSIPLDEGAYIVEAIDEDSGLGGADDVCAFVNFNRLSNGVQIGPDFRLQLEILHPLATLSFSDTVVVHPQPDAPNLAASRTLICPGDSALWASSNQTGNQWYFNGNLLPGATSRSLFVSAPGAYQVSSTNEFGCESRSEAKQLEWFEAPVAPSISADGGNVICEGETVDLTSSYATGNQWLLNGSPLADALEREYRAGVAGNYTVVHSDTNACVSPASAVFALSVDELPAVPVFENQNNLLQVVDEGSLPSSYFLQWQLEGQDLPGANATAYCATSDGMYTLLLIDEATDCSQTYTLDVSIDPELSCVVGVANPPIFAIQLAPNPVSDWLALEVALTEPVRLGATLLDARGSRVADWNWGQQYGAVREVLEVRGLAAGMYVLEVRLGTERQHLKVMVQ